MRIFFAMLNPGYARNYESVIRMLAERGHALHLAFSQPEKQADDGLAERLASEYPSVTLGLAPKRGDAWSGTAWGIRCSMDYLRYLDPRFRQARRLRQRALYWPLSRVLRLTDLPVLGSPAAARLAIRALGALEQAVPTAPDVQARLAAYDPDLLLVTPLVNMGSTQVDYVKAADALGVRTVLCVASWDNLTNKGLVRVRPDRVLVWNDVQHREAVELHGIDPATVVVTGAQRFDEWFGRSPSRAREEFCAAAGLPPDRPFFLYVCSSPFIAADEVPFVRRWLGALRRSPTPEVGRAGVLVRPHPQNAGQWQDADLSDLGPVSIWPRGGANPVTEEAKRHYFDSLYHSSAVIGINTSALIEAGIVGRPVLTVLEPQLRGSQEETIHFRYLVEVSGGILQVAGTFDEHLAQLADVFADPGAGARKAGRFVRSFVRPRGLDSPCTPIFVEAVEREAKLGRKPPACTPLWTVPARAALGPLATLGSKQWKRMKARGSHTERMDLRRDRTHEPAAVTSSAVVEPASKGRA